MTLLARALVPACYVALLLVVARLLPSARPGATGDGRPAPAPLPAGLPVPLLVVAGSLAAGAAAMSLAVPGRRLWVEAAALAVAVGVLACGALDWRPPAARTLGIDAAWAVTAAAIVPVGWVAARLGRWRLWPTLDDVTLDAATITLGVAGFVALDLANYWSHRLRHQIPAWWRFHEVHHVAPEIGPISAARRHPVDLGLARLLAVLPLVVVGPTYLTAFVPWLVVKRAAGFYHHSGARFSFGPLAGIVTTPAAHRLHHSDRPEHVGCNYGSILMVWDRLFGTYVAPAGSGAGLRLGVAGTPLPVETVDGRSLAAVWWDQFRLPFTLQLARARR